MVLLWGSAIVCFRVSVVPCSPARSLLLECRQVKSRWSRGELILGSHLELVAVSHPLEALYGDARRVFGSLISFESFGLCLAALHWVNLIEGSPHFAAFAPVGLWVTGGFSF